MMHLFTTARISAFVVCFYFLLSLFFNVALALGNHPDSTVCSAERPYQAICTHSLHNLEGWYGDCYATESEAQKAADEHAKQYHNGNSRWTGIKKGRFSAY